MSSDMSRPSPPPTSDLERLSAWLAGYGVTHVAMEATGVYWKPVWAVLCEADRVLVLANAQLVKAVPGRKTDVNDATWLADLLAHGLIRPSFVPPMEVQALRELTRTRKQLTREKASHVQRIDKLLQAANLKLGSVLSDIMGQSGRVVLDASYHNALFHRLKARRGPKKAIVAVAASMLTRHPRHAPEVQEVASMGILRWLALYQSLVDRNLSRPRGLGRSEPMDVSFASDEFSSSRLGISCSPLASSPSPAGSASASEISH